MPYVSNNVAVILKECLQSGSEQDWESFIHCTRALISTTVIRTLRRWSPTSFDAVEDLTQEVYMKLCGDNFSVLRSFKSERPEALIAYIRVVAGTVALDHLRANAAQKRRSTLLGDINQKRCPSQDCGMFQSATLLNVGCCS